MQNPILIADSGGSKTDWCFVDITGEKFFFTTGSFHPNEWSDLFFEEYQQFWDERQIYNASVYFYGAGCLNIHNQAKMKEIFQMWGFENVKVDSDIIGASIAHFGNKNGVICLLGTGSVAAKIEHGKVLNLYGGLGYLIGDEGSGVYFGKLLLNNLLSFQFSEELTNTLHQTIGSREEILRLTYSTSGKQFLASISKLISEIVSSEIEELHRLNFNLFIDQSLYRISHLEKIGIVGSYAFYNSEIFKDCMIKKGFLSFEIIQFPINKITEYFIKDTF